MRIALITDRFGKGRGGAELYLSELASFLVQRGHETLLVSMDSPSDFPSRTLCVDPGSWPRGLREKRYAPLALAAAKRERCDATLAIRPIPGADFFQPHGGAMQKAWQARGESKTGLRRAFWKTGHAFDLKFRMLLALERETLTQARKVFPVSQLSAESFRLRVPQGEKVKTVPLGVDFSRFSPQGEKAGSGGVPGLRLDAPFALFAAHDFDLKGLGSALAALARLRREGESLPLVVLGADRHLGHWQRLAQSLGLTREVHFLGAVQNPAPWYRAASVLLHPTFFDPCARVVLEALACGLPVVTTQRNGAWRSGMRGVEAIEHPRDDAALAAACSRQMRVPRPSQPWGFLEESWSARTHFERLLEEIQPR